MKIAITAWNDRISPLCDSAGALLLADIEEGRILRRRVVRFPDAPAFHKAETLRDLGVELLICGAITQQLANLVESRGIRIMPFITGDLNQVLTGFLADRLASGRFCMPGANRQRRGQFKRRRRGNSF